MKFTKVIDYITESFGDLPFILGYNLITFAWVVLGIYAPWFPDPYPLNFYTMIVSWLAINMSSLLLWSDRRKAAKAKRDEEHQMETLNTLLHLAEAEAEYLPLMRRLGENQVVILELLKEMRQEE